ncbi:probable disease resistance protein RPP1 [Rosa rugosa]|uniref:probable disease resistance protein RPP1 n=1 Tax=Rosa rugosa TaxID=74645 RepID=UPI002B40E463|nr:probable disease resistance protein RPP1 [Rosa rugosa]
MEAGEVMLTAEKLRVFPYLEELTLEQCKQLRSAPSHFPSLKKLVIREVESGMPIASILSNKLTTLTYLEVDGVKGLTSLPEGMLRNNKNLKCLKIGNCPELSCIAPHGFDCCASLESLTIWECPKLRYLSDGLLSLSLKELGIQNCSSLESIPIIPEEGGLASLRTLWIFECSLRNLPDGLQYCTSLRNLLIDSCPEITSIPIPSAGLPSLGQLVLMQCPELSSLPSGLGCCTSLDDLTMIGCPKVTSIPIGSLSTTLRCLAVSNLESLPILHGGFTSLRQLGIDGCQSTQIDLQFCQILVSLEDLRISDCPNLETVPSLDKLTSLRQLWIRDCSRLTCLPSGLAMASPHVFTRLESLSLGPFWNELDSFPALQVLPQLESLTIYGWPKLKSLPEQIQHLTSLTELRIEDFEGVEAIPEWLGNLASLHSLHIRSCKNLMYLPSVQAMQRLTKLDYLEMWNCPLLRERCTAESGPEWPKISHIPYISGI